MRLTPAAALTADPPVVQFFYRKLKPEARPIAQPKDMDVVVSAADCRLSAFATVDDATRCWIKVRSSSGT